MTKSFRDRKETNRLLRLNSSSRSGRMSPPKSASAPFMREPKYSNPMLVGGSVAAKPADSKMKHSYSGASYPASAKQPANLSASLKGRIRPGALALSVSAAALSFSLASGAQAQDTIPTECTPTNLLAGGTLTCDSSGSATPIGPIVTTVDGITITIDPATLVSASAGDAISATTAGGDISISGAHTVTGTGGRGITATSVGGDISIQGVG